MPATVYPFTAQDMQRAAEEWNANCGPAALAFALGLHINDVRGVIPGFEQKGYTSPTMMKQALEVLGGWFVVRPSDRESMFDSEHRCLVRIQFTGPWTQAGANPKWAYGQTHWIATYMVERQAAMVFDCNGGILGFQEWEREIVPAIVATIKRADGGWFPTHVWRIPT